jgi:AcrR family transcriptional regulator
VTTPEVRARGTRLPKTARRSQLLGAAREVFVAQGYHAAAMDEIADRAGVSKPVLYQHFPGKHELYLALVDQHAKEIVDAVRGALASTKDNKLRGALAIAAFFDFIDGEGESFRLIFESDLTNDAAVQQRVNWVHQECADAIAEIIAEETGLEDEKSELIGIALGGMAHTAARYWFRAGRRMPREEAIRMVAMLVWRGIAGFPKLHDDHDEDIAGLPLPASRGAELTEAMAGNAGAPIEGPRRSVADVARHDSVSDVHSA